MYLVLQAPPKTQIPVVESVNESSLGQTVHPNYLVHIRVGNITDMLKLCTSDMLPRDSSLLVFATAFGGLATNVSSKTGLSISINYVRVILGCWKNTWLQAVSSSESAPAPALWSPPPSGWIKLNFDLRVEDHHSIVAVIARDHLGLIRCAYSEKVPYVDPMLADEAVAALAVIQL
ncbi:hypothetical protein PanWU01x14_070280 [Parasponia andersonii]|uniref:Uncharacterized protein n=1 Tax=Parasponia andersonii TaxID=3476 RepID=A0A2P5DEW9_PARAD|nr:hypothetical protein PanWU01x14_070280 [Parasponia andersonii]